MGKFKCPECGSNMFGTTDCVEWINPIGHCHGLKSTAVDVDLLGAEKHKTMKFLIMTTNQQRIALAIPAAITFAIWFYFYLKLTNA